MCPVVIDGNEMKRDDSQHLLAARTKRGVLHQNLYQNEQMNIRMGISRGTNGHTTKYKDT